MSELPRALFRRYPALQQYLPWTPLGRFPTRIDSVAIEGRDGRTRTILVKRDDLSAGLYGGNKVRKLEYLLAEARRRQSMRLITVGAAGSHHALATTAHGRAAGFEVTIVLFPQPLTPHVRNILLMDQALGADIRWLARMEMVPVAMLQARIAHRRERPFVIAPGGSDALGTMGWVDAGLELAEQIQRGECPKPTVIHVAAGTLGTAGGLAIGLTLAGLDVPIAATRITSRLVTNERALASLVRGAAGILQRAGIAVPVERALRTVELRHEQIGRGYGKPTEAGAQATAAFAAAGLRLDDTYTAKAAADLLAHGNESLPLYVHTLSSTEPLHCIQATTAAQLPPAVAAYLAQSGAAATDSRTSTNPAQ